VRDAVHDPNLYKLIYYYMVITMPDEYVSVEEAKDLFDDSMGEAREVLYGGLEEHDLETHREYGVRLVKNAMALDELSDDIDALGGDEARRYLDAYRDADSLEEIERIGGEIAAEYLPAFVDQSYMEEAAGPDTGTGVPEDGGGPADEGTTPDDTGSTDDTTPDTTGTPDDGTGPTGDDGTTPEDDGPADDTTPETTPDEGTTPDDPGETDDNDDTTYEDTTGDVSDYDVDLVDGLDPKRDDDGAYRNLILEEKFGSGLIGMLGYQKERPIDYHVEIEGEDYADVIDHVQVEVDDLRSAEAPDYVNVDLDDVDWVDSTEDDYDGDDPFALDMGDGLKVYGLDSMVFDQPHRYEVTVRAFTEGDDGVEVVGKSDEMLYDFDPVTTNELREDWEAMEEFYTDYLVGRPLHEVWDEKMQKYGRWMKTGTSKLWDWTKSAFSTLTGIGGSRRRQSPGMYLEPQSS